MKNVSRILLCAVLCLTMLFQSVGALTLEAPAAAAEVSDEKTATLAEDAAYAELPALFDGALGKLVYFENTATDTGFTNTANVQVLGKNGAAVTAGYNTYTPGDTDIEPKTSGVLIAQTGDSWQYTDGKPMTGNATVVFEYYATGTAKHFYNVAHNASTNAWGEYYTPWSGSDTVLDAWTTFTCTKFNLANYDRIGALLNGWGCNLYIRSVALYVMPSDGFYVYTVDGSFNYFVNDEDLDGDTYTFLSPADWFIGEEGQIWSDGTSYYYPGETYAVSDLVGKGFYPCDEPNNIVPLYPLVDGSLGELIYFNNFSGRDYGLANTADVKVLHTGTAAEFDGVRGVLAGVTELSPQTIGVEIAPSSGTAWTLTDGSAIAGKLTLRATVYYNKDEGLTTYNVAHNATTADWGKYYTNWGSVSPKIVSKTWQTVTTLTINPATYDRFGFLSNKWGDLYVGAVGLYWQDPDSFKLADENGENPEIVRLTEATYTFPSAFGGVTVTKWQSGDTVYDAGQTVDSDLIKGKTFVVYVPTVYADVYPVFDKKLGELVWFDNFSGNTGFTNTANVKLDTAGSVSVIEHKQTVRLNNDSVSPETPGVLITPASGTAWGYTDGQAMTGTATVVSELYTTDADGTSVTNVAHNDSTTAWGGYYTPWTGVKLSTKTFTKAVGSAWNLSTYYRIGYVESNWRALYAHSVGLYVKADDAFYLTNEAGDNYSKITRDDTYTFVDPGDCMMGNPGQVWTTDGATCYEVGEPYSVSELNGKIFYPMDKPIEPAYAEVPALTTQYGKLVYFDNFSGDTGFTNLADIRVLNVGSTASPIDEYYCVPISNTELSPQTSGVEIVPAEGTAWKYTDGSAIVGKLTVVLTLYNNNDAKPGAYSVAHNDSTKDWGDYYTTWSFGAALNPKTWVTGACSSFDSATYSRMGMLTNTFGGQYVAAVAVYAEDFAPEMTSENSIRSTAPAGLRFKGAVSAEQREAADEYGFIVTRSTFLEGGKSLVFDADRDLTGTNADGVRYVAGASYSVADGIDRIYGTDDGKFFFAAVVYNVPETAYAENITARPYLVKNGTVFYGETHESSVYATAKAIKTAGGEADAYIDEIIAAVEGE